MRVAFTSAKRFDRPFFDEANGGRHEIVYIESPLNESTAALASGFPAICPFVNDRLNASVLKELARSGLRVVALRSAGFNHIDVAAAEEAGIVVLRVPAYSPHAVAEHTVALILTLNRKTHRAYNRVREHNFSLDSLIGFDLAGKAVGVVGVGKIGTVFARIMLGFGCRVLACDPAPCEEASRLDIALVTLPELLTSSDIVSLHCPLTPATRHMIDSATLHRMKPGAMLVNTSRGGLIDTPAVIEALKSGHLGALALDVYEEEGDLFFRDLSAAVLTDDIFARLLTFPNVLITGHQAFYTREAVANIAATTIRNLTDFEQGRPEPANRVTLAMVAR